MTCKFINAIGIVSVAGALVHPVPTAAETTVTFSQDRALLAIARPTDDADWATPCTDGLVPFEVSIDADLADIGEFRLPLSFFQPTGAVLERRGTKSELGVAGLGQSKALPTSLYWENGITRMAAPVNFSAKLHACGYGRHFQVMDGKYGIEGSFGVWQVSETTPDFNASEDQVFPLHSFVFSSLLHGTLDQLKYQSSEELSIAGSDIWGALDVRVLFEQPPVFNETDTAKMRGDIALDLEFFVVSD